MRMWQDVGTNRESHQKLVTYFDFPRPEPNKQPKMKEKCYCSMHGISHCMDPSSVIALRFGLLFSCGQNLSCFKVLH